MSKKLNPTDRKGIVITSDVPMHIYGGIRGPITSKYYETVEKIAAILADQAKVTQVTSKGEKIALDFTNFDKDLDPYDDEVDEVLELITCTPDKIIDLEVTKTATIGTDVEECSFESLNTEIATVTPQGVVTGVKNGETSIRVSKAGYRTVSVPITVIEQASVTCMPPQISGLLVGETLKITATPASATFKSESDAIATVTPEGVVEAKSQGNTKIIVSAEGYKATEVVVTTKNKPVIKCTPNAIEELYVDATASIETEPTGASFRSESDEFATVTPQGVVTGVKAGSTNIIVTKEGYQDATVAVTVKDKPAIECTPKTITELEVGLQETIATVPTGASFRSEDDTYATVTPEGAVTGVQEGSTNIIITKEGYQDAKVAVTVIPRKVVTCDPASIVDLVVGQTQQLTATPSNATFRVENPEDGFITVTPEGLVEAVAQGEAKVIVEAEGYQATEVAVTTKNAEE